MNYLQAALLAIIQGIGEFLPISSSGHLLVSRLLLGLGEIPSLFDILLHVATLIVVCLYFRKRILALISSLPAIFKKEKSEEDQKNLKMVLAVLIASPFTAAIGLFLSRLDFSGSPLIVFAAFIATGLLLLLTHVLSKKSREGRVTLPNSCFIGIAQGIALIPGISRSGSTIATAMVCGVNKKEATEFSFIISIPAILGAFILDMGKMSDLLDQVAPGVMTVAFLLTIVTGYLSLSLLTRLINRGKLYLFSFYLIPLGILLSILSLCKIITF